jgi:hypothetical protein
MTIIPLTKEAVGCVHGWIMGLHDMTQPITAHDDLFDFFFFVFFSETCIMAGVSEVVT